MGECSAFALYEEEINVNDFGCDSHLLQHTHTRYTANTLDKHNESTTITARNG